MRRPAMSRTDVLDLLGVASLAVFAYLVWAPLPLLVVGAAALFASWRASK
jgi:hypothetical protein